jgi:large conductance mechanosensitive channel
MLKEFKAFLFRGNVVDLAVAVVIGVAFNDIVQAIVANLITPLIGIIAGKSFAELTFDINGSTFGYGVVIDAIIKFVAIAAVIFFVVVKPMQTLAARRKSGEVTDDTPAPSDEAILLTEIRDLLKTRA